MLSVGEEKVEGFIEVFCGKEQAIGNCCHFSHPFLGTYEVVQFFDLGYLKGTHSGGWYTAPYPFHGILG